MARKKSIIRIPFLKAKINARSIGVIGGILLILTSLLLFISLLPLGSQFEGKLLSVMRIWLQKEFGFVALFVPVLLFLFALHILSQKKQVVKYSITIGLIFIFFALLGLFKTGEIGALFFLTLAENISNTGAVFFFLALLFVGLVVFLDKSIDSLFSSCANLVKSAFKLIKKSLDPAIAQKKGEKDRLHEEFIKDKKIEQKKLEFKLPFVLDEKSKQKNLRQTVHSEKMTQSSFPSEMKTVQPNNSSDLFIKPLTQSASTWIFPPLNLLSNVKQADADRGDVNEIAAIIEKTLDSFGISAHVVELNKGPAVTQYALEIKSGTRLSKITTLSNDLALAIAAPTGQVRIEAPIPGRSLVGIEIPNIRPQIVTLKSLLEHDVFSKNPDPLLVPLGLDVSGKPQAASIGKMPHCLVAGATGSGKSVMINAWISTLLFRTRPEDVRLILVDPKRVEMSSYNGLPHLLTPVINESEVTLKALNWTVQEMQDRYKLFASVHARNIESYNAIPGVEKKPYIVFMIDELADLMMHSASDVETLITRIAQLARATGIHLVLATQRPSVDVITGLMKANIPARLAFNVSSMIDSRVIIDTPGAEKLLGRGDMLFLPPDQAKPKRIQGPFITEKEVLELTKFIRAQSPEVHYTEEIMEMETGISVSGIPGKSGNTGEEKDPLFDQALELIVQTGKASTSYLQRRLKLGYGRASRIIDQLEAAGYIGPPTGSGKPREILKRNTQDIPSDTSVV